MNGINLLQPHLLNEMELRIYLTQRELNIPNINQLDKSELIKIFYKYAVPIHQRNTAAKTSCSTATVNKIERHITYNNNLESSTTKIKQKPPKIIRLNNPTTSSSPPSSSITKNDINNMTNQCKKIKISSNNNDKQNGKRSNLEIANQLESTEANSLHKIKRLKISWP